MRRRLALLLFLLHTLHLGVSKTPSEAKADVLGGEGAFGSGGIVGVDALAAGADGAEEVVDVEEQRQTAVVTILR